jgi:hypothetical protein
MTTSWANLVRMRPADAFRANVGGTVLGLATVIAVPWLLLSAAGGRWYGWKPNSKVLASAATLFVVVTLVDWGARLVAALF